MKVMVFGTFDILHPGHINFFKQAKKYGNYLIAVVARDKTVKEIKGYLPRNSEKKRLEKIKKLDIIDKVVLGSLGDKYRIVLKEKPDVICLGYDQNSFSEDLRKELKKRDFYPKIVRLKPYKEDIYKSSKLCGFTPKDKTE